MTLDTLISPLREFCVAYPARRRLIALSGGLDSIVLLHAAVRAFPNESLYAIHVNHGLQADATMWQMFCAEVCHRLGVELIIETVSLDSDSENAARSARYQAFIDHLDEDDQLLMAHHQNDQAETLLFRLLRGAGLRGLSAMPCYRPLGRGHLLRPLLAYPRQILAEIAHQEGLCWQEDPSNASDAYARNFLRHEILPRLTQRWPAVDKLAQTAHLLRSELALLDHYQDEALHSLLITERVLDLHLLLTQPTQRQQPLFRHWIYRVTGVLLHQRELTALFDAFCTPREDAQPQHVLASMELRRYRQALYLVTQPTASLDTTLPPFCSGVHAFATGKLEVTPITVGTRLAFREDFHWQYAGEGRTCRPVGRPRKSLKKLFQEASIPPWQRRYWPVLMHGEVVAAVAGLCICENYHIVDESLSGFQLKWQPF